MSDKTFLLLDIGQYCEQGFLMQLRSALESQGATVETLLLAGNYDTVLDRLAQGAVPVVLKS